MSARFARIAIVAVVCLVTTAQVARAQEYNVDAIHGGISFKVQHLGLAWVPGRFNDFSGSFKLDADPSKCAFTLTIKTESIDTNNKARDEHLRNAEFFDVKQFPTISFKSTAVKATSEGYQVTGDFTMHGVTKPLSFAMKGGKKAEFPKGVQRTGFATELVVKRSDFGMNKALEAVGDDVHVAISFEGTKK